MQIEKVKLASTPEEARSFAIDWQHWIAEQRTDLGTLGEWYDVFVELGKKFNLTEEFEENGII